MPSTDAVADVHNAPRVACGWGCRPPPPLPLLPGRGAGAGCSEQLSSYCLQVCAATHKIAVLPGDGIGPEITAVALKVGAAPAALLGCSRSWLTCTGQLDATRLGVLMGAV